MIVLDAHEWSKPIVKITIALAGGYVGIFSGISGATDGEKFGTFLVVTLFILGYAIWLLWRYPVVTVSIIWSVILTAAWQYGRPFILYSVAPYVQHTVVPFMTPLLVKAWVMVRAVPEDVWYQAAAGLTAAALGFLACKWVFGGSENLGVILIGLTAAFLEAICSGCERMHLTDKESINGFFLYLTTLFLSGFAVRHRLMQLGKYVPWVAARFASKREEWPPSIYKRR
jgi:hypothetical protein